MTTEQYDRAAELHVILAKESREKQLQLLASAEQTAQPLYVIGAAGYWLNRWRGRKGSTRGLPRRAKTVPVYVIQDAEWLAKDLAKQLLLDYVNNWRKRIRSCSTPSPSTNAPAASLDFSLST